MPSDDTVICRGESYSLLPQPFWHLAHPGSVLFNNVYLSEGICPTISTVNRMPGLENAVSPYALRVMQDRKEGEWERVRLEVNDSAPSRKGAMFLVESLELAEKLAATWFQSESRYVIEARVVSGSRLHRADARWLDCGPENWNEFAHKYWSGEQSPDSVPEVLVDGLTYFPGWKASPFGIGKGLL